MNVDDSGDDIGLVGAGIDSAELQVSIGNAMIAQLSALPSEPAMRAFLRLNTIERMVRSTTLDTISMQSSSMKRVSPPA